MDRRAGASAALRCERAGVVAPTMACGWLTLTHAAAHGPQQSHQRHRAYWNAERIQGFWSGELFLSEGTGQELSYHLATLLVGQLAVDWPRFAACALAAQRADGGQAAAHEHLGMGLGGGCLTPFWRVRRFAAPRP